MCLCALIKEMATITKKKNPIAAYFFPFGLKQLTDLLMLGGAIVLLVGLFTANIIITVGLCIYALAAAIAIFRSVKVLTSKINKRSPEYKAAIVNTVVMGIIFVLTVFGIIYSFLI